jgi:predicted lipoprotein with Yx(FWY)xxD motif
MHKLRKVIIAVAIPVAAVVGVALTAGVATGAPSTAPPGLAATQPPQPIHPNIPFSPPTDGQTVVPPKHSFSLHPFTIHPPTRTLSPSRTLVSPLKSITKSGSASPGVPVVPGPTRLTGGCNKPASSQVTIKIATVGGKHAVVDQNGCALYMFNQDTPQHSACTGVCARQWTPLINHAPQAGSGVTQANLGTFTRPENTMQVTYFGHQLYYFSGDTAPGQANGQNNSASWFLVNASGKPITQ